MRMPRAPHPPYGHLLPLAGEGKEHALPLAGEGKEHALPLAGEGIAFGPFGAWEDATVANPRQ
jgi:hypothetical protein